MLVKNINIKIQEALKARERALSRIDGINPTDAEKPKDLPNFSDISSRSTFVRMISNKANPIIIQGGVLSDKSDPTFIGPGASFAKATEFGFKNIYKTKSDGQIRPFSGIKDISVEYTGGYSAIRKGTINWTASSLDDLERFAPHFLNIGNTVLLDWGWIYKRKELNNYSTFYDEGTIDSSVFSNPMSKIFQSNGNYDAIGGTISNFEYTLTEDGGFDCVTYLTSIGINLFNATRVDKGSGDFVPTVAEDGKKNDTHSDDLISALINLPSIVHNEIEADEIKIIGSSYSPSIGLTYYQDIIKLSADKNNNLFQMIITARHGLGGGETVDRQKQITVARNDYFVRWGWLEDNIFSRYSSYINNNNEILSAIRSIETVLDPNGDVQTKEDGSVDYDSVLIRNNPKYLLPKNPLKFILPGQNISIQSIESVQITTEGKKKKATGIGLEPDSLETFGMFLSLNSDEKFKFADPNNSSYGRIRNILVNVREIQKAFGIKHEKVEPEVQGLTGKIMQKDGAIYGTDVVSNPPADIKSGIKRLLSALNNNFHAFWNFQIVQDSLTLNIKVIDAHATSRLTGKSYTRFAENSNKVQSNGMYKFPAFKLGSMVKSQNLSFKVPDSMAVTAAYGSNKNKSTGIRVDTTNTYPELETFFESDARVPDSRLDGLKKAFRSSNEEGHKVGNKNGDDDALISKEGSFLINPSWNWWSKWTEKRNQSVEKHKIPPELLAQELKKEQRLSDFAAEIHLLVLGKMDDNDEEYNRSIYETLTTLDVEYVNAIKSIDADDTNTDSTAAEKAADDIQKEIDQLNSQLKETEITNKYYTVIRDDDVNFRIELFSAGESVLRAKLFNYDKKSSLYQTNWLIPAELSLEVDGIGGITPGDILQTDYILPRYNEEIKEKDSETILGPRTFFQTFGIIQKVSSEEWSTEITTKMRMNNSVLEKKAIEIFIPKKKPVEKIPIEKINPELIVETVYGCMDSTPGSNTDVHGQLTDGVEVNGELLRGYKATNYDPEATIQQVSEEDMSNPCTYPPEIPEDERREDVNNDRLNDLLYNATGADRPQERFQPTPIPGCVDQLANNYIFEDDTEPDGFRYMNHPVTGQRETLVSLVEQNAIRIIPGGDVEPCQYDDPEPTQTITVNNEDVSAGNETNVSTDNYEPDDTSTDNDDTTVNNSGTSTGQVNTNGGDNNTPFVPNIVDTGNAENSSQSGTSGTGGSSSTGGGGDTSQTQDQGSSSGGESGGGSGDTATTERSIIDAGETTGVVEYYYGCMDKAAENYGLDVSGKPLPTEALEDPDFWVLRQMGPNNFDDPCKYPVPEPEPERGTKCTDEQLTAGYQSRYGRYNLAKGGIFEDHPTDKEQIIASDGDTVIELQWHCIPPEPKEDKVEKVSNQKKEIITAPTIITTNQQPQKLYSTYKGTFNQNYVLLYRVTPWYASTDFERYSYYGEVGNPSWIDGTFHGKTTRPVSFWIRKKFWDEFLEAPNLDGVSKWKDNESDLEIAYQNYKDSTGDFAGYDLAVYDKGKLVGSEFDENGRPRNWLTYGKQFSGPLGKGKFPKNMGQSSANEIDNDNPIRFNKPIGYIFENSKVKQEDGIFQTKKKRIWR